jgi:hypothetical protein
VGSTRRAGILACDVQTSQRAPELDRFREEDAGSLERFVREQVARGELGLRPDPQQLLSWLRAPGLAAAVAEARLLPPWLWDLGEVRQLVYGLTFRRAS